MNEVHQQPIEIHGDWGLNLGQWMLNIKIAFLNQGNEDCRTLIYKMDEDIMWSRHVRSIY